MAGVVHIPLLGPDGQRPKINVRAVTRCVERHLRENPSGIFQSLQEYDFVSVISSGPREVIKVTDVTGDEHALKRINLDFDECFPHNCIREIEVLRRLDHPNVVKLQGFVTDDHNPQKMFFSMEYCQENLSQLLKDVSQLEQPEVKCLMTMLLNGTSYLHSQDIMHRDMSPKNLLIYPSGMLKIGDFGKASEFNSGEKLCDLGTPGYRAPELILGYKLYTSTIDMWSIGCIFGELLRHKPVFRATTTANIRQFNAIVELCGSPVYAIVPNFSSHSFVTSGMIRNQAHDNFNNWFSAAPISAVNLLEKLLTYDYSGRIKAEAVLGEEYFSILPVSCPPEHLKITIDRKRKSLDGADGLSPISSEMSNLSVISSQFDAACEQDLSAISSGDFSSVEEGEIE